MLSWLFAFSMIAGAIDCLDPERVQAEIIDQFQIQSLGNAPPADLCNESNLAFNVYRALLFLKDLNIGAAPGGDEFDRGLLGDHPYDFFKQRTRVLLFNHLTRNTGCTDGTVAYAEYSTKTVKICPAAVKQSTLSLAAVLVHEARHLDGREHAHQICRSGSFPGEFACDQSYEQGGSYAVSAEFFVRVSRATNLPDETREYARAQAISFFVERFNQKPFGLKQGAILIDDLGQTSFYDGQQQSQLPFSLPANVVPTLFQGTPLYFAPQKPDALAYLYAPTLSAPLKNVLTKMFTEELTTDERAELKDVVFGNDYACLLLSDEIYCTDKSRNRFRKMITHFTPTRFLFQQKSRVISRGRVHLLADNQELYYLPATAAQLKSQSPTEWSKRSEPFPYLEVSPLRNGFELTLEPNGNVSIYSPRRHDWSEATGLAPVPYRHIQSPFYWSPKLFEL